MTPALPELVALLPCPFCGGDAKFDEEDFGLVAVLCDARDGGCGAKGGWDEDESVAATYWNTRATQPARDSGLGEDARDAARLRYVLTVGSLPRKTVAGYHYHDGVSHPTPRAAIDAALAIPSEGELK